MPQIFDADKDFESEIEKMIQVYEDSGIVTRKDVISLDSRSCARRLFDMLEERGYKSAIILEIALKDYRDYSSVIFNTDFFSAKQAEKYMYEHVLTRE